MKRPDYNDKKYGDVYYFNAVLFADDMDDYVDYLEKELDFYWRGGAQIESAGDVARKHYDELKAIDDDVYRLRNAVHDARGRAANALTHINKQLDKDKDE